jgi:3-phosphoshikimate 1-carboxyvinyltransferase
LLAAPAGPAAIQLIAPRVRPAYVGITLAVREAFGADATQADEVGAYLLPPIKYEAPENNCYAIEPDLSAASYFLALTTIHGGQLTIPNLTRHPIQGDAQFLNVLKEHGLTAEKEESSWVLKRAIGAPINGPTRVIDFENFSDTFLTYAAIAPLLGESVTVQGIGHTRHQETDRIAGMAKELNKLGQTTEETKDSLRILPNLNAMRTQALAARKSGKLLEVETYEDHRFAMSFAILGSFDLLGDGQPWLTIKDPACCGKTFPDFFSALKKLQDDSA